jgi:A/G-specific adenine glycosylase
VRRALAEWYAAARRDLPWRDTGDPYRIWVSEIMLQQTRVATVIPYYHRFLDKLPDYQSLAATPDDRLLAAWAGLGYYSRARNLRKAARLMVEQGGFPRTYEAIRELPGVGDYTAAAVASIAFGLPHAVLDGNVLRVMSRLTGEAGNIGSKATRERLRRAALQLLPLDDPGAGNQALMELGATVCLPKSPLCLHCPVAAHCEARLAGRQGEFPVRAPRPEAVRVVKRLLRIEKKGAVLLWRRGPAASKLAGFWELPEAGDLPKAKLGQNLGRFRHTITRYNYTIEVIEATLGRVPARFNWIARDQLAELPLSTMARKAFALPA